MKKELICYCIDLDRKNLEIKIFTGEELHYDLKHSKVRDPRKLSDYDRKVFLTLKDAQEYLALYKKTLKNLSNKKICIKMGIPTILYKRRYIVQSLLGEKNQTYRDSPRVIKMMEQVSKGDYFNLFDQTFFLTVKLTRKIKLKDGSYKYEFVIPAIVKKYYK